MAEKDVSKGDDIPWLLRWTLSPGLEVDNQARIVSYEEYTQFGLTTYQLRGSSIEAPSRYRFATYLRDHETGLHYCQARYYCPWLVRWMSPDPLDTVDGLNLYCYVSNDPVNWVSPTGTIRSTGDLNPHQMLDIRDLGLEVSNGGSAPKDSSTCSKCCKCVEDCCTSCADIIRDDVRTFCTIKNVTGCVMGGVASYFTGSWAIAGGPSTNWYQNILNCAAGLTVATGGGWLAAGAYASSRKSITGCTGLTAEERNKRQLLHEKSEHVKTKQSHANTKEELAQERCANSFHKEELNTLKNMLEAEKDKTGRLTKKITELQAELTTEQTEHNKTENELAAVQDELAAVKRENDDMQSAQRWNKDLAQGEGLRRRFR